MRVRFEFQRQDCWVGVFWARTALAGTTAIDVWVCLLPTLPLHLSWTRRCP